MTFNGHFALNSVLHQYVKVGALKPGFRSSATLKLVVNVVGELQTEKNSCGIARGFQCRRYRVACPPGVPLPLGDGLGSPLPRKFLNFLHKNGVFWCTLEHGF